jgi:outer membrane protein assembly factor BamD
MGRYPESTAAKRARIRIRELNELFAAKEYKNGMFYLRLRAYDSAIIYFKDVIAEYGESSYAPLAVLRLVDAYRRIGYEEEEREMCDYLRQFYPETAAQTETCGSPSSS